MTWYRCAPREQHSLCMYFSGTKESLKELHENVMVSVVTPEQKPLVVTPGMYIRAENDNDWIPVVEGRWILVRGGKTDTYSDEEFHKKFSMAVGQWGKLE